MAKTKFVLNYEGVGKLLKSEKVLKVCHQYAEQVAERAGDGYEVDDYPDGKTRVNVSVRAATEKARQDNFDNNTLLKALK